MLDNLRLKDLYMISQLPFSGSIRELARQQKVDPQNLTKRIQVIEEVFGCKILNRSTSGYSISPSGELVVEIISSALNDIQAIQDVDLLSADKRRLRFCSRAYVTEFVSGRVFAKVAELLPEVTFDFTDMSPERTERAGRKGLVDLILSFDDVVLGNDWQTFEVGDLEWGVFVRKGHPLTRQKKIENLMGWETVGFCYIESNRFIATPSSLHSSMNSRYGPGAENTRYTSQIIQHTDCVGYLPKVSVVPSVSRGELVEIHISGFQPESRQLRLHAHIDRVKKKWLDTFLKTLKQELKK